MENDLIKELELYGFKLVDGDYEIWLSTNINVLYSKVGSLCFFDRNGMFIDYLPNPVPVQTIEDVKSVILKCTDIELKLEKTNEDD